VSLVNACLNGLIHNHHIRLSYGEMWSISLWVNAVDVFFGLICISGLPEEVVERLADLSYLHALF